MTQGSQVTEGQCEGRMSPLFSRLNSIDTRLSNIEGRLGSGKWIVTTCISILSPTIAVTALFISVNGGCTMAKKAQQTQHMNNLAAVDTIGEYAQLKREISDKVRELGLDYRFPVSGSRNYVLEADGTLWMEYAGQKKATNRWESQEWKYFVYDCKNGLWPKLERLAAKLNA